MSKLRSVKLEEKAIPVIEDGVVKYAPGIRFDGTGGFHLVSHQGNVLVYDTKEEALAYFED